MDKTSRMAPTPPKEPRKQSTPMPPSEPRKQSTPVPPSEPRKQSTPMPPSEPRKQSTPMPPSEPRKQSEANVTRKQSNRTGPAPVPSEIDRIVIAHTTSMAIPPPTPRKSAAAAATATATGDDALLDPKISNSNSSNGGNSTGKTTYVLHEATKQLRDKHIVERALVGGFAICLLWITSLIVAESIVKAYVRTPQVEQVELSASKSINLTLDEKERYETCANRRIADCQALFQSSFNTELNRMNQTLEANKVTLASYKQRRDECEIEVNRSILVFNAVINVPRNLKNDYPTSLTNTDQRCKLVDKMVAGQAAALGALGTATEYKTESDGQVVRLANSVNARAAYDAEYMANKTNIQNPQIGINLNLSLPEIDSPFNRMNGSLDQMMACISQTKTYNGKTCQSSLLDSLNTMRSQASSTFNQMSNQFEDLKTRTNNMLGQVESLFSNLRVPSVTIAVDTVFIANGLPTLNAIGFNSVPVDFPLATFPSISPPPLPDIASLNANFEAHLNALKQKIAEEKLLLSQVRANLTLKYATWHIGFMEDYNPPVLNTTTDPVLASYNSSSSGFLTTVSNSLGDVNFTDPDVNSTFVSSLNASDVKFGSTQFLKGITPRKWDLVEFPLEIQIIIDQFNSMSAFIYFADTLFRVIRSIQLFLKYWRISAVTLPPADVRILAQQGANIAPSRASPVQRAAYWASHPFVNLIIILVLFGLIFSLLLAVYVPIYENYIAGCVQDPTISGSNGTFITKNAYTISYEYAASDGDTASSIEIDRLNSDREINCRKNIDSSTNIQTQQEDELQFIKDDHSDNQFKHGSLTDCINVTKIDTDNIVNVPLVSGVLGANLRNFTTNAVGCKVNFAPLANGIFNCTRVPICDITCVGPNPVLLEQSVHESGCLAERYIHATIIGSTMSIIVFIFLNISRKYVMRGLVRMFWRNLTIGRYSYLATCRANGDLVFPEKVVKEKWSMKKYIALQVKVALRAYERYGLFILICALSINIPWLVVLTYVGNTMYPPGIGEPQNS